MVDPNGTVMVGMKSSSDTMLQSVCLSLIRRLQFTRLSETRSVSYVRALAKLWFRLNVLSPPVGVRTSFLPTSFYDQSFVWVDYSLDELSACLKTDVCNLQSLDEELRGANKVSEFDKLASTSLLSGALCSPPWDHGFQITPAEHLHTLISWSEINSGKLKHIQIEW